jgi:nitrogen regulatory protein P-II 1
MTRSEAIIQPARHEPVKPALTQLGRKGMTTLEGRGRGGSRGKASFTAGANMADPIPKIKLELVLFGHFVDAAVDTIVQAAATGRIGDGRFFLSRVAEAIRIRQEERGVAAL